MIYRFSGGAHYVLIKGVFLVAWQLAFAVLLGHREAHNGSKTRQFDVNNGWA